MHSVGEKGTVKQRSQWLVPILIWLMDPRALLLPCSPGITNQSRGYRNTACWDDWEREHLSQCSGISFVTSKSSVNVKFRLCVRVCENDSHAVSLSKGQGVIPSLLVSFRESVLDHYNHEKMITARHVLLKGWRRKPNPSTAWGTHEGLSILSGPGLAPATEITPNSLFVTKVKLWQLINRQSPWSFFLDTLKLIFP